LIVPAPSNGDNSQPPSMAPTMPTTTFKMMPCCPSVFIIRLASHPMMPPTMSQMMTFMESPIRSGLEPRA
jgi:hypothetical protein